MKVAITVLLQSLTGIITGWRDLTIEAESPSIRDCEAAAKAKFGPAFRRLTHINNKPVTEIKI